jgi:hypothetical protein
MAIPLHHIAKLCSGLTKRWLILEWVPSGDPMFRQLLRGRGALYAHLSADALLGAMSGYFRMERMRVLANGRILYLFEKIAWCSAPSLVLASRFFFSPIRSSIWSVRRR